MTERIRQPKPISKEPQVGTDEVVADSQSATSLTDALDDILDQIDEVLEQNAEEFVKNYVQKGGQ